MTRSSYRKEIIDYLKEPNPIFSEEMALLCYDYQYNQNTLFRKFCDALSKSPSQITSQDDFAYLPISTFKNHLVKSGSWVHEKEFWSSATTGTIPSKHLLRSSTFYKQIIESIFTTFFGSISQYYFLCLLPSYLERENSSLVFMANHLINQSINDASAFYLNDLEELNQQLIKNNEHGTPTILLGVTYALMDLAEKYTLDLSDNILIMETGGMKGNRQELPKSEIHQHLKKAFDCKKILSEYGMTELLSHFYSLGDGLFNQSYPSAQVSVSSLQDPLEHQINGRPGRIKIIDLANVDTCSFIMTDDIGILHPSGQFEIMGRVQDSELRGCNLMYDTIN